MTVEASRSVSVAEAKAHLSEILDAVERGENIEITRRGVPIANLVPKVEARKPITMEFFDQVTAGMKPQPDSVDLVRQMRDEGY